MFKQEQNTRISAGGQSLGELHNHNSVLVGFPQSEEKCLKHASANGGRWPKLKTTRHWVVSTLCQLLGLLALATFDFAFD
jgi:hypothetical protein